MYPYVLGESTVFIVARAERTKSVYWLHESAWDLSTGINMSIGM
jgi:hypothetical protein